MTDFRALCAELVDAIDASRPYATPLLDRARAALAEPDGPAVQSREPASVVEQPSEQELLELMPQQMRDDLAAAARALAGFDPDNTKAASVFRIILNRHVADYARAVLARWGTAAPQPIPVTERLPGAGDCDAEGRCWMRGKVEGDWRLVSATNPGVPNLKYCFTHWLPAHALPLPKEVE
jgi:hypothetical protein